MATGKAHGPRRLRHRSVFRLSCRKAWQSLHPVLRTDLTQEVIGTDPGSLLQGSRAQSMNEDLCLARDALVLPLIRMA